VRGCHTGSALVTVALLAATLTGTDAPSAHAGLGSTDWKQVSAGRDHTCAITTTEQLFCWGDDSFGQLGDDASETDRSTPVEVEGAPKWKQVSLGSSHTCAVKTNGRLYCWGRDTDGQLGDDILEADQAVPVQVSGNAQDWSQVGAGGFHTCARKSTGELFCWGSDVDGQLGNSATLGDDAPTPVSVAAAWKMVGAGGRHTCAVKSNEKLFCWGADDSGQLGDGADGNADDPLPVAVAGGATNWKQVDGGDAHTCAAKRGGQLLCWGNDAHGQVGDGDEGGGDEPAPEVLLGVWRRVSAGEFFTCARRRRDRLSCWGRDNAGQLGNDVPLAGQPAPVDVSGAALNWENVSAGDNHACAIKTSRRLFCWGNDADGELGDGDDDEANEPTPVEVTAHG
jgi:alpha-tubulin suppressor-like RCC1 family protein